MKKPLKIFAVETFVLYIASSVAYGMIFENGFSTLLLAGLALVFSFFVIKPIINLLLLPLNLITFNLFRWVSSAVTLYLVTLIIPGFKIVGFDFPGLTSPYLDLPSINLTGVIAYVAFSFLIAFLSGVIYWLFS